MARENNASNNFYDELIKSDFYQTSKTASVDDNTMSKNSIARTLEESFSNDQIEALAEELDIFVKEAEAEAEKSETLEDKVVGKKEKKEPKDQKEKDEKDKEEDEEEEEAVKEVKAAAYDLALEKLANGGLTVGDYVASKINDEEVAEFLTENAIKLAFVTEQNPLMVADDIMEAINEKLAAYEE